MRTDVAGVSAADVARPRGGLNSNVQVGLNLAMVRTVAVMTPFASVTLGSMAVIKRDVPLGALAGLAILLGGLAIAQLAKGRPRALVLSVLSGVGLGGLAPFMPYEVAVAFGTGITVTTMTGILLLSDRRLRPYVAVMALAWASYYVIHFGLGRWPGSAYVAFVMQAAYLAFGIVYLLKIRSQLEHSEERYAYLFKHAPVALWENDFSQVEAWLEALRERGVADLRAHLTADPDELRHGISLVTTIDTNRAAAALTGADDPADLRGRFPPELLDAESRRLFLEQFVSIWDDGPGEDQEYTGLRIDGSGFQGVMHWSNPAIEGGDLARVVTAVSDVTDQVQARRELENLVRSKDDFIASISHEIRTPLTAIVGYIHLLGKDPEARASTEYRQMIETLVEQSADLSNIVEDLLTAAKADMGRLRIAQVPTDLRAQSAQALETWNAQEIRHVELSGPNVRCIGDPARVRQVVRNLLTNAFRYGGDRVWIRVGEGETVGRVTVADNGPGIPTDEEAEAFQRYRSSAPDDGLTAALGIGLPLSRDLARLMHGDLTYERVNGEARFELTLPLAVSEVPQEHVFPIAVPSTGVVGTPGWAENG